MGTSTAATWESLVAGRSGIGPVTHFDASELPVRIAGEVSGFDPETLLGTRLVRRSARVSLLAVAAASIFAGLVRMGPLSERNHDPEHASRPFDADRDGFVFGEGAVVLVLESAAHPAARGARSYGTVAGGALTSDAFHISAPQPSGADAAETKAIRIALGADADGSRSVRRSR